MDFSSPTRIPFRVVIKTVDETLNNNDVLQADDELKFGVLANEVWEFQILLIGDLKVASDITWSFGVPAGASMTLLREDYGNWLSQNNALIVRNDVVAAPALYEYHNKALYIGGANGGNVQLYWAQETAAVEDTVIKAKSYIIGRKLN